MVVKKSWSFTIYNSPVLLQFQLILKSFFVFVCSYRISTTESKDVTNRSLIEVRRCSSAHRRIDGTLHCMSAPRTSLSCPRDSVRTSGHPTLYAVEPPRLHIKVNTPTALCQTSLGPKPLPFPRPPSDGSVCASVTPPFSSTLHNTAVLFSSVKFPFKIAFQRSAADFYPIEQVKKRVVFCARTQGMKQPLSIKWCARSLGLHKTYFLLATMLYRIYCT